MILVSNAILNVLNVLNHQLTALVVPLVIGIILIYALFVMVHVMDVPPLHISALLVLMDTSMLVTVMVHAANLVFPTNLVTGIQPHARPVPLSAQPVR